MKPERWLATVLFTDIVASTETAAEVGDRRWRELLERHHALARRELARHGGRELNMTGDGFLATFEVPERAIRCAVAIRDAIRGLGLEIRGGLHTGEVELIGKSVGGLAVHIGARVAAQAAPGEVLVSSTVRDVVAGSGFEFQDRGSHALKGVPGEWRLYAVTSAPVRMDVAGFWERAREARLPRVLLVYLAAAVGLLGLTALLRGRFGLPAWIIAGAAVLLLIGLAIIAATAWIQAHPLTAARAEREEVPGSWEIDLRDMGRSVAGGRLPHLTWGRSMLGGVVAFSLLFGLAGLYVVIEERGRGLGPEEVRAAPGPALAVLPFRVVGADTALWREGMVDLVSTNLDGAAGIRTIDPRVVLSKWRGEVDEGAGASPEQALRVARELGARHALLGSMVTLGGEVRLAARLYDVRTGKLEGETQVNGAPDSIPKLVDRLSVEVLRAAAAEDDAAASRMGLRQVTSTSIPALKAYLAGEQAFRRSEWEEAIGHFTRALEADSTFALAVYRIATASGWLEGPTPRTAEHFERAGRLTDRLPEREALLLKGNGTLDLEESVSALERLTTRYPDDVEGWTSLGDTYFHVMGFFLQPYDKFRHAFRRALELDPSFGPAYIHLIQDAFARQDSAEARRLILSYGRTAPTSAERRGFDLAYALAWGDVASRDAARAASDTAATTVLATALSSLEFSRHAGDDAVRIARAISSRSVDAPPVRRRLSAFFVIHASRGHVNALDQDLLALAENEGLRPSASRLLLASRLAGLSNSPAPRRAVEALSDSPEPLDHLLLGALAADAQRWDAVDRHVEALRSGAGARPRQEDPLALDPASVAEVLRAYAALRRGDRSDTVPELERALSGVGGYYCPTGDACLVHGVLRLHLARMLLERGDLKRAERHLKSLELYYGLMPVQLYLGRLYEASGDPERARLHYAEFVSWWRECDPELKPLWDEGRRALERLKGIQRL